MLNKQQAKELLAKIIQTIKMHLYILEPGKEERFICEVSSAITDMENLGWNNKQVAFCKRESIQQVYVKSQYTLF